MSTVCIVQARMGSTRLPGKVLQPILGKPMIWWVMHRLSGCRLLDQVVIATTTSCLDDPLVELCQQEHWSAFRGSEDDVLDRYHEAAVEYGASVVVRVTSDCPVIDPAIVDKVVSTYLSSDADYCHTLGFPRGFDTEAFGFGALAHAHRTAHKDYEREHVTPFLYQHPETFRVTAVEATGGLRRPDLRLTVDTKEDLALVREVFGSLHREGESFHAEAVVDLLDRHPELPALNAHVRQKELGE